MSGRFTAVLYKLKRLTYKRSRTVKEERPKANGGIYVAWSEVPDGTEMVDYRVNICHADVEALARKAARNKGGRAVDGPLEVEIIRRVRTPEPVVKLAAYEAELRAVEAKPELESTADFNAWENRHAQAETDAPASYYCERCDEHHSANVGCFADVGDRPREET